MSRYDDRPGPRQRGYSTRWDKASRSYRLRNPWCVECLRFGRYTPSKVVDHIVPHKQDSALFWNRDNWQALCERCHNAHKQREERGGGAIGCDTDGVPIDRYHPWNLKP